MTNFWKHATAEQRIAQIRGAVEVGMTVAQLGMNVGAAPGTIRSFAYYHGIHFGVGDGARRKLSLNGKKTGGTNIKVAKLVNYRRAAERFGWEQANSVDARIFPANEDHSGNLFDPIEFDTEVFA